MWESGEYDMARDEVPIGRINIDYSNDNERDSFITVMGDNL